MQEVTLKGVTLIGMPGAGKSTIGKMLAARLNYRFLDLDDLIKEKEGKSHTVILDEYGPATLCALENKYTLLQDLTRTVFSPGGSIVYSSEAMNKLRSETVIINLELPLVEIKKRLADGLEARGIVGLKEKGLAGLYAERVPLYRRFAHHTIQCASLKKDQILDKVVSLFLRM